MNTRRRAPAVVTSTSSRASASSWLGRQSGRSCHDHDAPFWRYTCRCAHPSRSVCCREPLNPDWAGVGYQFRIPRADVYFSIRFGVYNRAFLGAPSNEIGVQDFVTCPYVRDAEWNVSCFDHAKAIGYGAGALRWESTGANVDRNRSGRIVRGIVSVVNGPVTIYRARVKVVYGTLE